MAAAPPSLDLLEMTFFHFHNSKATLHPKPFGALLNSQVGTIQLTTEAVLNHSKQDALFALLADPVVDNAKSAEALLDTMLSSQKDKTMGWQSFIVKKDPNCKVCSGI